MFVPDTQCHIPEGHILHIHHDKHLNSTHLAWLLTISPTSNIPACAVYSHLSEYGLLGLQTICAHLFFIPCQIYSRLLTITYCQTQTIMNQYLSLRHSSCNIFISVLRCPSESMI